MKVIRPIDLNSDGGFSRASIGTYFDVNRVLRTATTNEPRFNYNTKNGLFEGLLLEPESTNLLLYSEDLSNSYWSKTANITVTSNTDVSPYGTVTADTVFDNGVGDDFIYKIVTVGNDDSTYVASVFIKKTTSAVNYKNLFLVLYGGFVVISSVTINSNTGELSYISGQVPDATIEDVGLYWRISKPITNNSSGNTWLMLRVYPAYNNNGGSNVRDDSATGSVVLWGMQLERRSTATSYIPTTTTSATRAADVVTGTGLIWTDLVNAYANWNSGTTYALGDICTYNSRYYESLQNSNLNKQPDTNPTFWLDIGPDNRHAALDGSVSTASSQLEEFTLVLKPGISFDSFALINTEAKIIKVAITDPNDGVIYSETFGLSGTEVYDWYQYFFYDPTIKRTQIVDSNIPPYSNSVVTIKLQTSASSLAKLGLASIGNISTIGLTRYGVDSGIIDYSVKETDEFGNTTFVKRAFSKRINADVYVNNFELNRVQRLLFDLRAKPSVWIASDDPAFEEALIVYGFYRDFSTRIAYPRHSICNIEIEGLI